MSVCNGQLLKSLWQKVKLVTMSLIFSIYCFNIRVYSISEPLQHATLKCEIAYNEQLLHLPQRVKTLVFSIVLL